MLIVTRLIADADKVAHKVNALAGREVAVAHHSENKLTESVMATYDVLVITHQAFMNAAQAFAARVPDRWDALHLWNRGTRSLIIVDEALANAVDHNTVTSDDLDVALRAVPHHLREQVPLAIKVLETLKTFLEAQGRTSGPRRRNGEDAVGRRIAKARRADQEIARGVARGSLRSGPVQRGSLADRRRASSRTWR